MSEAPHAPREILLRLGEIWLKGRNRNAFVERLQQNVRQALRARIPDVKVVPTYGRILVRLSDSAQINDALAIVANVPGVVSASPMISVTPTYEAIEAAALAMTAAHWGTREGSFAVKARRSDKHFPMGSPELGRALGSALYERCPRPVDLKRPDFTLGVDVDQEEARLWVRRVPGIGGLPVGISGRSLLMLSGGIDSPVAGYLAQKRGCRLDAIYFHSPPFISEASRDKVEVLAQSMARRQGEMRLHVVPFTDIQKAIKAKCHGKFTVLLYRRFMYRIAAAIARRRGLLTLCTGENLGQVASQTMENLHLVDRLTDRMTLRPLLTYDKLEIIGLARRIGTYETSILPHDDCCTLFVPRNPATRAKPEALEREETRLEVEALVATAVCDTETVRITGGEG
jgi:thiamine biosynthesis protein ThiI